MSPRASFRRWTALLQACLMPFVRALWSLFLMSNAFLNPPSLYSVWTAAACSTLIWVPRCPCFITFVDLIFSRRRDFSFVSWSIAFSLRWSSCNSFSNAALSCSAYAFSAPNAIATVTDRPWRSPWRAKAFCCFLAIRSKCFCYVFSVRYSFSFINWGMMFISWNSWLYFNCWPIWSIKECGIETFSPRLMLTSCGLNLSCSPR